MEITRRSKLMEVLNAHPALEDHIIEIAPAFKNLRNPILRRTVGQLATIESVAQVGGLDAVDLVNRLRRLTGQAEVSPGPVPVIGEAAEGDPAWISGEPTSVVNGTELLDEGEVPLERVNELLRRLPHDGYVLLLTHFEPTPIIEAMGKQRRPVYHRRGEDGEQHYTYIRA